MKRLFSLAAGRVAFAFGLACCLLLLSTTAATAQTFAKGADVGWLQQMEAHGYKFYDEQGVEKDCFQILKAKGINSIRLRVWVNPSMTDWVNGHCSPAEVVTMATRARSLGFRLMIDFHYSDSWADPGKQTKPAAWASHSFAQLLTDVYDHTTGVMNALKANGVTPEWVQVGNEIPGGILWPEGSTTNFGQLTQLLNQGYDAVKAVSPASKVVIHLDKGNDNARFRSFFDLLTTNGGKYDVIGMSYYPYWLNQDYSASIDNLQFNLSDMASRYGKEVVIAEVGGDCTTAPQNNYDMLVAVQNAVAAVPNGKGLGVFYWEPEGYKSFSGYQLSAWGNDGKPSPALNAFLVTPTAPPVITNLTANPGFEADGATTQTPTGWSSWANTAANYAADYTEAGGQTGSYRLSHYLSTAYQASTYQIRTGLPNGTYTLRAWAKCSGGQTTCQLYAKNYGGTEKNVPVPVASAWTLIQITGIQVSNGQCEIGLWSDAKAGNWANLDNVVFFSAATGNALRAALPVAPSASPAAELSLYPNPSSGSGAVRLVWRGVRRQSVTVRVVDLLGRPVVSQQLVAAASGEASLLLPDATPAGVYLVTVSDGTTCRTVRWSREP